MNTFIVDSDLRVFAGSKQIGINARQKDGGFYYELLSTGTTVGLDMRFISFGSASVEPSRQSRPEVAPTATPTAQDQKLSAFWASVDSTGLDKSQATQLLERAGIDEA